MPREKAEKLDEALSRGGKWEKMVPRGSRSGGVVRGDQMHLLPELQAHAAFGGAAMCREKSKGIWKSWPQKFS